MNEHNLKINNIKKMRELKFRAKATSSNQWVYGLPFYCAETCDWKMSFSNGWQPSYNNPDEGERTILENIEIETLGQFTGLKDQNGTEIYEGDILLIDNTSDGELYNEIGFKDACFGYMTETGYFLPFSKYKVTEEVAGNIHDNPELLKRPLNNNLNKVEI